LKRGGEVFWAEHPERGRRSAVVMTRDEAIGALDRCPDVIDQEPQVHRI
jgi:hypothetical protein